MPSPRIACLFLVALFLFPASVPVARAQESPEALAAQVKEILHKHCYECHGKDPKKIKGEGLKILDLKLLLERKVVVPKSPADSTLIQRIEDDNDPMPPNPRSRVPDAERKLLRAWIAVGAPPFTGPGGGAPASAPPPPPPPVMASAPPNPEPAPAALAARVKELFRARCFTCHGGIKKAGGIANILDDKLLRDKQKIVPGNPEGSRLYQLVAGKARPPMPEGQPPLKREEIDTIRDWLAQGAPKFPDDVAAPREAQKDRAFQDIAGVDYVYKRILAHLRSPKVRADDRGFLRFFSMNHLLGQASNEELELHRQALAKAINHLTYQTRPVLPEPIDPPYNTVFAVDIRKLGWDKQPLVRSKDGKPADLNFFDLILFEYPYDIIYQDSETVDYLIDEFLRHAHQVRPIIYVRADWFVSTATLPPLYHDLLQLPFTLKELEEDLGVNAKSNLDNSVAIRGGLSVSGVSHNNRVVERHPTNRHGYGAYWKSFDYRSSVGPENIFKDPVNLNPAGGEIIFNLPNGLQGYFVVNGKDERLDFADTAIVTDRNALDQTVRTGLSCMRCHDTGMKDFADDVRKAVDGLPGSTGFFDKRSILQLYPGQEKLNQALKEDRERFVTSLENVLRRPLPATEPLTPVSKRFLEWPLQLNTAAAEIGKSPQDLLHKVNQPALAVLGLAPLAASGTVRRDAWEDYFDQIVGPQGLGLGIPVVPLDGLTRPNFQPSPSLDVELTTNKPGNVFTVGDYVIIFVKNKSAKNLYIELIGTNVDGKKVILPLDQNRIRPGETYRFAYQGVGIPVGGQLGKSQLTLFASDKEFPPGELLRGKGRVADRVVHRFFELSKGKQTKVDFDASHVVKKTIVIETK